MFYHGFNNYMEHAYPSDELMPITCSKKNTLHKYGLTLVDALDTIFIMGNETLFVESVKIVLNDLSFDRNVSVSVFETNIRILGALLSTHLIFKHKMEHTTNNTLLQNQLLTMAEKLGDILALSFITPTGLPFGAVNYKYGVAHDESIVTSTASCGTFLVEFGVLSHLTQNDTYILLARKAAFKLYKLRNAKTGLVGNHINIKTGIWTHRDFSIGAQIDSYFEYLLKSYNLFGNVEYIQIFNDFYKNIEKYIYKKPWYVEVQMDTGQVVWTLYNSLASFWPGVQAQYGDISNAMITAEAYYGVWMKLGCTPEGFNILLQYPQQGQYGYPLRPELSESLYHIYQKTKDPILLYMGKVMVHTLNVNTRVKCGFANVKDSRSLELEDKMESFFLAETLKYLYLLFDEDNFVNKEEYIFNTEGHIIPPLFYNSHKNIHEKELIKNKEGEMLWKWSGYIKRVLLNDELSCPISKTQHSFNYANQFTCCGLL